MCNLYLKIKSYYKIIVIKNIFIYRQFYQIPTSDIDALPSVKSLTKTKYEPGKQAARRVAMLNKLFMKYVTDIMSTGTLSMNIVGKGIEISKVHIFLCCF